jgi:hypothetical protein
MSYPYRWNIVDKTNYKLFENRCGTHSLEIFVI